MARRRLNFASALDLPATLMEVSNGNQSSLESQSNPVVFVGGLLKIEVCFIETTKKLGWCLQFLKSESDCKIGKIILLTMNRLIKLIDIKMRSQNWHICLTLDNFSAHYVSYEPQIIWLVFFEPNLTSFVQPLDARIIHFFKAHYQ